MAVSIFGASGYGLIIGSLTKILENWHRETTTRARKLSMIQAFVRKKRLPRHLKAGSCGTFATISPKRVLLTNASSCPMIVVKGDILAREGCVGTEMFILNTGIIEVRRTSPDHTDWIVVLEVLIERGVFGEASLLEYAPHANSYTAKATSDLFTLPKEDFDQLIEEFPDAERALLDYHQERSKMYDFVFEQTLARYRVYIATLNSDPVSEMTGLENLYPTLTVLLDGVLKSYRSLPLPVLQALDLQLSMGVSVFNSATEKMNMIWLLSQDSHADVKSLWLLIFVAKAILLCWNDVQVARISESARVVRLVFRVGFIAHLLTCGYFLVARIARSANGGPGIQSYFSLEQSSNGEMYIYFLYWAVTTMTTVGYGDTTPHNVAEIAYVSVGVLIGASTFTYVVGTLSSVVEELNESSDTFRTRMDHLKAYLRERKISQPLAERLRRYYEYYLLQRDDEKEETILAALSDDLRSQLVLHLNRDVVSKISFFATQDDACVGRHMYFLVKGAAEVVFKAGTSEEQVVATLLEGSYFGEIAMLHVPRELQVFVPRRT
ncbi:Cyclic nucleotide-binding-like [Phytophthora cactorum]|nr:Cyclic nucleotide-binding-like [Phytophthora cactorum]